MNKKYNYKMFPTQKGGLVVEFNERKPTFFDLTDKKTLSQRVRKAILPVVVAVNVAVGSWAIYQISGAIEGRLNDPALLETLDKEYLSSQDSADLYERLQNPFSGLFAPKTKDYNGPDGELDPDFLESQKGTYLDEEERPKNSLIDALRKFILGDLVYK